MKKILLYFLLFFSCKGDGIKDHSGRLVSYKDSTFLEIEGDLILPERIVSNWDTWTRVLKRLERHSWREDSLLMWNVKMGSQINVGENVFNYIIGKWERENVKLRNRLLVHRGDEMRDNLGDLISYRDSVFLEIEGNLNHPDTIWRAKDTWIKALERLERHLKVENNLLTWNVKEGRQINMGENVFHFIIEMWERDNARVRTGRYKLKHVGENRYVAVPIVERMKSECEE